MNDDVPVLWHFPYSHFNEKARWALDWKRIPHRREGLLPGPHAAPVRRLSGQTQTPVLCWDDEVIHGSARILEFLDRVQPEPPLYPADPEERRRVDEVQAEFDEEVGPGVRRALFASLLDHPGYTCRIFSSERAAPMRALYRASFPLAKGSMRKGMGIRDAESVESGIEITRRALDRVAKAALGSGLLVGERFSAADLTAAALLAPAVMPEDSPMCLPRPRPASLEAWLERWRDHPGAEWVRAIYREHRPDSAEVRRSP